MKSSIVRIALGLSILLLPALGGCGSDAGAGSEEEATGNLNVALVGSAPSGVLYRLRNAQFELSGPSSVVLDSESDPNALVLSATLVTGSYLAALNGPWFLERMDPTGPVVVQATLASPNPVMFQVQSGTTSSLVFQFATDGTIIDIGTGNVDISIAVTETTGGGSCTMFDPSACPSGTWCGPITIDQAACLPSGMLPIGSVCSTSDDCQAGSLCGQLDPAQPTTCIALCDLSGMQPGACPAPMNCLDVGSPLFGVCL